MAKRILRGVPSSLKKDGWWLDPITRGPSPFHRPHAAQNPRRYALQALILTGLIAIAQISCLHQTDHPTQAGIEAACGDTEFLGFHAADGLRSLEAAPQYGTPL